jgi:uncharacterized protein (DUF1810 family)
VTGAADPFDLRRFVAAQRDGFDDALAELRAGRKEGHWIWYVLPQMRGLGASSMSARYGIGSLAEARAYLAHPVLGPRLAQCVEATARHEDLGAERIFGPLDAMKFRSCLTLFAAAAAEPSVYSRALERFFGGERDPRTLQLLADSPTGENRRA